MPANGPAHCPAYISDFRCQSHRRDDAPHPLIVYAILLLFVKTNLGASAGLLRLDLNGAVPIGIEVHHFANVPESHIVLVVDHKSGEFRPLAVDVDGAVASDGGDLLCGGVDAAGEHDSGEDAGLWRYAKKENRFATENSCKTVFDVLYYVWRDGRSAKRKN